MGVQDSRIGVDERCADAKLIFLVFFSFYALIGRGAFFSSDEGGTFNTALSLLAKRSLAIAPGENVHPGVDGRHYACREILPSVTCVPTIVGGMVTEIVTRVSPPIADSRRNAANWPTFVATTLIGPLFSALTLWLLHRYWILEGVARKQAAMLAVMVGLATPMVVYSKTIFGQVFEATWLVGALYAARQWRNTLNSTAALQMGIFCGLGMMSRAAFAPVAFFFAVYMLFVRGWRNVRSDWRDYVRLALPVIIGGLVTAWVNWLRWGSPLDFGYHSQGEGFHTPVWKGAFAMLLSPGRGIFWYTPALFLVVVFARRLHQRGREEFCLALAITVVYLAVYGRWGDPYGGLAWSTRFLVSLVPLWAALLGRATLEPMPRFWNGAIAAVTIVGIGVQFVGWAWHPQWQGFYDADPFSFSNGHWVRQAAEVLQRGPNDLWLISTSGLSSPAYAWLLALLLAPSIWGIMGWLRTRSLCHAAH